jgi:hypothetical protein
MTVCVLGVDGTDELEAIAHSLSESGIVHHLWIEKPETIPTALATSPVTKENVAHILGHLKLLR